MKCIAPNYAELPNYTVTEISPSSLQHIPVSRTSWVICIKTEKGKRSGHLSSSASPYSPLPSALATSRLPHSSVRYPRGKERTLQTYPSIVVNELWQQTHVHKASLQMQCNSNRLSQCFHLVPKISPIYEACIYIFTMQSCIQSLYYHSTNTSLEYPEARDMKEQKYICSLISRSLHYTVGQTLSKNID